MITLHYGKPGGGKSYSVVRFVVIPALSEGRRVISNIEGFANWRCRLAICQHLSVSPAQLDALLIPVNDDAIRTGAIWSLTSDKSVFVIDEIQLFWPGGSLKPTDLTAFDFLTKHRHLGVDVHLITQNHLNFNTPMRALAQNCVNYRKLGFFGLHRKYQAQYYEDTRPQKEALITTKTHTYDPVFFNFYQSVNQSASHFTSKQKNLLLSRNFILFYIAAVLSFGFFGYRYYQSGGFLALFGISSSRSAAVVPAVPVSAVDSVFVQPVTRYYTSFFCLSEICFLLLDDGKLQLVDSRPFPSGLVVFDKKFYLPRAAQNEKK